MSKQIEEAVRGRYGSIAASGLSGNNQNVRSVAEAFGYSAEELSSIPAEANMGLSCGNPTAYANLRPGETVVDLGCGGGLDVFLAAGKVGPSGKAVGIDMTPEMIERARRNAQNGPDGKPFTNVEFYLAGIDNLPLPDNSVDCVISNCVINLAPDKQTVFREIARVLKPGGRLAVSDIALKRQLPAEVSTDLLAYVGCVAGAILIEDYKQGLAEAGLGRVEVVDTGRDLNVYAEIDTEPSSSAKPGELPVASSSCCSPSPTARKLASILSKYNINDYAASVRVYALKTA